MARTTPTLQPGSTAGLDRVPQAPAMPLELTAYRIVTRLARPLAGAVLDLRARRGKEDPARRSERLGHPSLARPDGALAWVHAASIGEASAVLPLVVALGERRRDLGILLTTGTVTSARYVASRLPEGTRHQYVPLDSPALVGRFLDHWKPAIAVLTEQEVWPNLIVESHARGIAMVLVNARMSERSFARWQKRPQMARALFARLSAVLAQNDVLAKRFAELGAPRSIAAGNLKVDAPPPRVDAAARAALEAALGGRPRLVAASTHEGEELVVAEAHRRVARHADRFCTILAPRHPERGPALAQAIAAAGLKVARRSNGELPRPDTDIYVADTIGELGTFYAASPLAFIGGSLVARGGQNPIEAVRHGAVVLTGPSQHNFDDAYRALLTAGGAAQVTSSDEIAEKILQLMAEPGALADMRAKASRALESLAGALGRTLDVLLPLLPDEPGVAPRAPQ